MTIESIMTNLDHNATRTFCIAILRPLVVVQMTLFLFAPPFAVAAVLGSEQWLFVVIPWGICCAVLNDWARKTGLSTYEESKVLPVARIGGKDSFHVGLLKINACVLTVLAAALLVRKFL